MWLVNNTGKIRKFTTKINRLQSVCTPHIRQRRQAVTAGALALPLIKAQDNSNWSAKALQSVVKFQESNSKERPWRSIQ
jgi:hypothetical protein